MFNIFWRLSPQGVYRFLKTSASEKEITKELNRISLMPRFTEGVVSIGGNKIIFNDQASFIYQYTEIFIKENYKIHSDLEAPLIFDCGANIGLSVLYFKKLFPKSIIHAFEADPVIAGILDRNVKSNGLNNVFIDDKAVWIDNCRLNFGSDGSDGGSIYKTGKQVSVNAVRLNEYIEKESKIFLIKLDVEGAESEILEDCRNSLGNVDNLFVEYHSFTEKKQDLHNILRILTGAGFRYYLQPISDCRSPFLIDSSGKIMDLQINIYAKKMDVRAK